MSRYTWDTQNIADLESTVDIKAKEDEALSTLYKAMKGSEKQLIAFSGGKDSIVVAHLATQLGMRDAICEISFCLDEQIEDIKKYGRELGLNCEYKISLTDDWLRQNPEVIFADDSKIRAFTYHARQQTTIKRYAKKHGFDCQILGRRHPENRVPSTLYKTGAGLQCHPIRNWNKTDVWHYFQMHGLRKPWIYDTTLGELAGNAPWYSIKASDMGTVEDCWTYIKTLDSRIIPERYL